MSDACYDNRFVVSIDKIKRKFAGAAEEELDMGLVCDLKEVSRLVKEFIKLEGEAFSVSDRGDGFFSVVPKKRGKLLVRIVRMGVLDAVRRYDKYRIEPYVELAFTSAGDSDFIYCCSRLEVKLSAEEAEKVCVFMSSHADELLEGYSSKAFQSKLNSYNRSGNKNYSELMSYIQALFDCRSRYLVLRVDFSYRKEYSKIGQVEVMRDRERFFSNTRSNKLFKYMEGYIWKLEHGSEKGFHFHCMFFFDGSKVREDGTMAKLVGQYWQNVITHGKGLCFNCNASKERYRRCGIGMVRYDDLAMRDGLKEAVFYLTKGDLYMKLQTIGRSIGRGNFPAKRNGRGRPRINLRG